MNRKFENSDIPYDILNGYGITQEMVDDLPQKEMDALLEGRFTSELPIRRNMKDGSVIRMKAAISLIQTPFGTDVLFTSRRKQNPMEEWSSEERNILRNGKVLQTVKPGEGLVYAQLDDITNQVITAKADIIQHNIDIYKKKMNGDDSFANDLKNGKVVTIEESPDDVVSIGIDLHSPTGIHYAKGFSQDWKETRHGERLPKYNFGLYGCWVTDKDGRLDHYVKEEKYTKSMNDEMDRQAEEKSQSRIKESAENQSVSFHR